jgi:hypothetical protein
MCYVVPSLTYAAFLYQYLVPTFFYWKTIPSFTMSLDALSDELLVEIVEFVNASDYRDLYNYDPDRGWRSLAKFALCSRRLNRIATPILYRNFKQTGERGGEKRLPTFLHLLKEKPELGACVKSFTVSEISKDDENMDMKGFSRQDVQKCGLGPDAVGFMESKKPNWLDNLEAGDWRAVVAFLLFLLPALEEIDITCSSCYPESGYIDAALAYAASQQLKPDAQHSLRHLMTVWMDYWDTEMGMSINVLLPFCALPSVTAARINRAFEDDFQLPSPPPQCHVLDLHISHSNIGPEAIGHILRCFPSLKVLHYGNAGSNVGYEDFLPQYLGGAISHLHETLEELTVLSYENKTYGDEETGPIGSLTEFKNLKRITTYYDCLLKPDPGDAVGQRLTNILPSSLERLAVSQCEPDILEHVRVLLEQHALGRNFLSLKKIALALVQDADVPLISRGAEDLSIEEKDLIVQGNALGISMHIVHPLVSWMSGSDFGHYKEFDWTQF